MKHSFSNKALWAQQPTIHEELRVGFIILNPWYLCKRLSMQIWFESFSYSYASGAGILLYYPEKTTESALWYNHWGIIWMHPERRVIHKDCGHWGWNKHKQHAFSSISDIILACIYIF